MTGFEDAAFYGDRWAEVYDDHFSTRDVAAAVEFLAGLAGDGPVLELAIGTGRVALPLAAREITVHGIDASRAMVDRMRAKPGGEDIPVTIGDMTSTEVTGPFRLIYLIFNTLFILLTQDQQSECFRNVARMLEPGGAFVIECFVPDLSRFHGGQAVRAAEVTEDSAVLELVRHDAVSQRITVQSITFDQLAGSASSHRTSTVKAPVAGLPSRPRSGSHSVVLARPRARVAPRSTRAGATPHHRSMRSHPVLGRESSVLTGDNLSMTTVARTPATPLLRRILLAPFSRQAWADLAYAAVSIPLAVAGFIVTVVPFVHAVLVFVSTPTVRWFGSVNRMVLHRLLGEQVPPPPPMKSGAHLHVATADPTRLTSLVVAAGGRVQRRSASKIKITGVTAAQLAELAAREQVAIQELKPHSGWLESAARDVPGWRARAYLVLKFPVSLAMFAVAAGFWVGGIALMSGQAVGARQNALPILLVPVGLAAVLAAPWLMHSLIAADRWLIRSLLGPPLTQRVQDLELTRAHAVDDSAARLRSIERDLHDGAQAQLVGLAMKLGLARDKLGGGAESVAPADLDRALELVDSAHRSAIDAITELRVLARGIHPPVLDNGLPDALTTLAARSAVPVELVTDIPERPSAAIETIAYFCAAELIANVAKHSGARHATLEAVHVPGLLRIRVTDDGRGGARPETGGGLRGLAERIRTVDGRIEIDSPPGGPTEVTVELPSHA